MYEGPSGNNFGACHRLAAQSGIAGAFYSSIVLAEVSGAVVIASVSRTCKHKHHRCNAFTELS